MVNLPQPAGFVPTPKEWSDLVRIAENLGAQVVQRDAALRQMEAERDAARAEVARLTEYRLTAAQKIELWVHDADQFSPRTPAEDMVVQDGQLEALLKIAAALRQPAPAPAKE